jgi:hypothetical protein
VPDVVAAEADAIAAEPALSLPPLDLPAAVELWPAVVDLVKDRNAMLAALLKDARPVGVSDRELLLEFPSGAAFLKRKAEQEDHRRAAADAVQAVSGRPLSLRYELGEDDLPAEDAGAATLSGEELVQRFLAEFDAQELLDDDDPDDEREA